MEEYSEMLVGQRIIAALEGAMDKLHVFALICADGSSVYSPHTGPWQQASFIFRTVTFVNTIPTHHQSQQQAFLNFKHYVFEISISNTECASDLLTFVTYFNSIGTLA